MYTYIYIYIYMYTYGKIYVYMYLCALSVLYGYVISARVWPWWPSLPRQIRRFHFEAQWVTMWLPWRRLHGCWPSFASSRAQGQPIEIHGKSMGNLWEIYGKSMGNVWEIYGKSMGNQWEIWDDRIFEWRINSTNIWHMMTYDSIWHYEWIWVLHAITWVMDAWNYHLVVPPDKMKVCYGGTALSIGWCFWCWFGMPNCRTGFALSIWIMIRQFHNSSQFLGKWY